ncbi:hypothetical protein [Paludisphaera rhizosphaerae]|nr:hypothetical protein [Paludisphaera rhizosphaerae]
MTIRRAMIAVAVAAVLIAIWAKDLPARRRSYLADAAYHERREAEERQQLAIIEQLRSKGKIPAKSRSWANAEASHRVRVPYHMALKEKYRRAASFPWETPEPDPTDPGEALVWKAMEIDDIDFPMPTRIAPLENVPAEMPGKMDQTVKPSSETRPAQQPQPLPDGLKAPDKL